MAQILVENIIRTSYLGEAHREEDGTLKREQYVINERVTSSEVTNINQPKESRAVMHQDLINVDIFDSKKLTELKKHKWGGRRISEEDKPFP